MGQYDLDVVQRIQPRGVPLKGDEAVVVDGPQRVHHVLYGQRALADELRHVHALLPAEVVDVHVAHVLAQVGDGGLGVLVAANEGGVHVPGRAQAVVGEVVEQIAQPPGIGVGAGGLDQKRHRLFAHHLQHLGQPLGAGALVVVVGVDADVVDAQVHRHLQALHELPGKLGAGEVRHGVHAGHRQPLVDEPPAGHGGQLRVGGAGLALKHGTVDVVELHALQPHVFRHGAEFAPVIVVPVLDGERELHFDYSSSYTILFSALM